MLTTIFFMYGAPLFHYEQFDCSQSKKGFFINIMYVLFTKK